MSRPLTLDDFDFDLPEDLIALRPARPRSAARLLVASGAAGPLADARAIDLPGFLSAGDLLVFNDTQVIPARLSGIRRRASRHGTGAARVELTLIEPGADGVWTALARPAKRLAAGDVVEVAEGLAARVLARDGAEVRVALDTGDRAVDTALEQAGEMPLPPYIAQRRAADAADRADYQTMFARRPGAVASPTAALHFDDALIAALDEAGIARTTVTLHVGAGTFLPVTAHRIEDHRMHAERGEIGAAAVAAVDAARARGARVIPVGTTSLRLLESAAAGQGRIAPFSGRTDIFIRPGHSFGVADGLMTNFHLPRSTLMMLVSALMGVERIREVYAHAVAQRYRFFSYGDASLLLPGG